MQQQGTARPLGLGELGGTSTRCHFPGPELHQTWLPLGAGGWWGEKMCLRGPVPGLHKPPNVQPDDGSWSPTPAGALQSFRGLMS